MSKIVKSLLDEIELLPPFLCFQRCCQQDDPVVHFDALLDEVAYLKVDVEVGCHHLHQLEAHHLVFVPPLADCCPRPRSLLVLMRNFQAPEPPCSGVKPPHPACSQDLGQ